MMYELIKGTLGGQDGNKGYSEEIIGVFRFLEEAIDCCYKKFQNGWTRYYARNLKTRRIINLPIKAELKEKTRWIPVKKKLPEKDGKYLVCAVMSCTPDHADEPCEYQQIAIASFLSGKYGSDFYGSNLEKVIAWMPLPDPYEPWERSDKE